LDDQGWPTVNEELQGEPGWEGGGKGYAVLIASSLFREKKKDTPAIIRRHLVEEFAENGKTPAIAKNHHF